MIHSLIWQAAITPIMALNTKCNTRLSMKVNIAPHVLAATTLNILLERLLFLSSSTHPCYTHMLVFSYFWAITPPHCLLYLTGVINQNTYDHLWICFPPLQQNCGNLIVSLCLLYIHTYSYKWCLEDALSCTVK